MGYFCLNVNMAEDVEHNRVGTLYDLALLNAVRLQNIYRTEFRYLPDVIQCDIYYQLFEDGELETLAEEILNLEVFAKALRAGDKRVKLYCPFQTLVDREYELPQILSEEFVQRCETALGKSKNTAECETLLTIGWLIGGFLSETGWDLAAEKVYQSCLTLCDLRNPSNCRIALKCLIRLLRVCSSYCKFTEAKHAFESAAELVQKLRNRGEHVNTAVLYAERSSLLFALSEYEQACVVKRKFQKAETLIRQAMELARYHYGEEHPKFADTLVDYGFYLLNVDSIHSSVEVYTTALQIRGKVFGWQNLHVATAHEDLAYALYVHEYSSGNFTVAKCQAECAIAIVTKLFPDDHLLLASSKRVKALILEEIAIDCRDKNEEGTILKEAQELHLASLELARKAFGESNVQTAKHYGNLGRLYQSMRRYKDYEVALSLGHLASLYNYDMERYDRAEELYIRSIAIGRKLFGDGYSGLEYDYRGLINLYDSRGDLEDVDRYHNILLQWREIRELNADSKDKEQSLGDPKPTEQFIAGFLTGLD